MRQYFALMWLIFCLPLGCGDSFTPYNELKTLRVLAIAADKPWYDASETALVTPLLFVPEGDTVQYEWTWCPFPLGSDTGYECAVDQQQFDDMFNEEPLAALNITAPSLSLGSTPTVTVPYFATAEVWSSLCEALKRNSGALFSDTVSCDDSFPLNIKLRVFTGKDEVVAVKELRLMYDAAAERNHNPTLDGLSIAAGSKASEDSSSAIDGSNVAKRNKYYSLFADIGDGSSENYVPFATLAEPNPQPQDETLIVTWFVQAGETKYTRTSYIPGANDLDAARMNNWLTPESVDFAKDTVHIAVVLRDLRGGVTWIEQNLNLSDDP